MVVVVVVVVVVVGGGGGGLLYKIYNENHLIHISNTIFITILYILSPCTIL